MAANQNPIYTLTPSIRHHANIALSSADYTGAGIHNYCVFQASHTNGSYVQKLRFKALGTNGAAVARIYINNGKSPRANVCGNVAGLTGTPQTTGGFLPTGTYIGKVFTIDPWGAVSTNSAEVSASVTGPTGRIDWFWTANTGANSYIITVGPRTSEPVVSFYNANASYQQTTNFDTSGFLNTAPFGMHVSPFSSLAGAGSYNNAFIGEVSLPATTAATTTATIDVEYPLNFALPAGWKILIGLGAAVNAGWSVTTIAGDY